MMSCKVRWMLCVYGFAFLATSCTTPDKVQQPTLHPPPGNNAKASSAVEQGNRLFAEGRWEAARQQYDLAIQAQSDLAEAHYNMALALERLGNQEEARRHYIEAANLAPGHKVIWDSPPLRRYGNVPEKDGGGPPPVLPALGGSRGPLGGGGGGYGGP